eukprot:CAMPEP_0115630604 /NCGR_PEP_ID=MMETSP0272-20121206/30562_1 /TAXON_ID=71861 /ORGANISM="Scrippsiella trochoidea, Strain CCMP3099" /LENGTH=54 /DNA_ID=CAMNT_0003067229 /DNA_START=215 /DNA_END=376 /DNA_ORIENTATION=-
MSTRRLQRSTASVVRGSMRQTQATPLGPSRVALELGSADSGISLGLFWYLSVAP